MTQNRPKEALALIPPVLLLGICIVYVHHRLKVLRHEIAQWTGRAKAHEGFPMSTSGPLSEEEYQARKQQLEATRRSSESP